MDQGLKEWPRDALPRATMLNGYRLDKVVQRDRISITYQVSDDIGQPFLLTECFPRDIAFRDGSVIVARSPADDDSLRSNYNSFLAGAKERVRRRQGDPEAAESYPTITAFAVNGTPYLVSEIGVEAQSSTRSEPDAAWSDSISQLRSAAKSQASNGQGANPWAKVVGAAAIIALAAGGAFWWYETAEHDAVPNAETRREQAEQEDRPSKITVEEPPRHGDLAAAAKNDSNTKTSISRDVKVPTSSIPPVNVPNSGGVAAPTKAAESPGGTGIPKPVMIAPKLIHHLDTDRFYPPISRRLNEEGLVALTILVGTDGRVQDAKISQTSGYPRLDNAAVQMARSEGALSFQPGTTDGKPAAQWVGLAIKFAFSPEPSEQSATIPQPPITKGQAEPTSPPQSQPSFDCAKTTRWSEHAVCADPYLSKLDVESAYLYRRAYAVASDADRPVLLRTQVDWIRAQYTCEHASDGRACLIAGYTQHIGELSRGLGGR